MAKDDKNKEIIADEIRDRDITDELQESYLDYAMSVIVSRALPDVRDGLKPVQRRILWAMWDDGLTHSARFRKSANVIGSVLGKYHPHGDSSVYDALARMAQDFSLRYPLIDGQGNWGSIDGDPPAAMRYCVTGDTKIVTNKGLLSIKNIVEDNSNNPEQKIDISILSKDRKINKASKWFDSDIHPTIKITTNKGYSIKGSHNHPILVWYKNPKTGIPNFKWKLLEEVKEGDVAVLDRAHDLLWPNSNISLLEHEPELKNNREDKILPKEMNKDLAHILGALTAEGSITKNKIEFCNSDINWINEFTNRWERVFPDTRLHRFKRNPSSYGKKSYERLEIHSRHVINFLNNLGLKSVKSPGRSVPNIIFKSTKECVSAFLQAYFEGDGSMSFSGKMTELSATSKSQELLSQLQLLLLRFGIVSTKRFDEYRDVHKLYIRGLKNYEFFNDRIGFISERKIAKLKKAINRLNKKYSQTDFVPFLSSFVRSLPANNYQSKRFITKNNFDRYSAMETNQTQVLDSLETKFRPTVSEMFEKLLENNYIFEPINTIEKCKPEKVYSIKVDSDCHSFVANGFINHNTEARLSGISEELLRDIEKDTVDWGDNYDNTKKEPTCLPAKLPNLLLNGTMGIAVGMATSIPPHNLVELVNAIKHLINDPKAGIEDLMKYVPGPDFPTGGIIYDRNSIEEAYATGRGSVTIRAVAEIIEEKSGFQIVVTEIPYQVVKSNVLSTVANLVQNKKIEGIKDIRDESDREGLRVVVELKKGVNPNRILNQLYKHTDLQKNFYFNMVALMKGLQPQVVSLKDILSAYIDHREEVVRRKTEFELSKAEARAHILEGLVKALEFIDEVIALIKKSKDKNEAHTKLVKKFDLTPIQADAILEMKLQTLASLETTNLQDELKEKKTLIKELKGILSDPKKIKKIITDELDELIEKYGDERRTKMVAGGLKEFKREDFVPKKETVVVFTSDGYIKRVLPNVFKSQKRGGKGLIGFDLKEEDKVNQLLMANTHNNILFFTDKGKVYQTKVYEIPESNRTAKGKLVHTFLGLDDNEKITTMVSYPEEDKGKFLTMVTKKGAIKRVAIEDFKNVRKNGIIAINLKKDDFLNWVRFSSGKDDVIIATENGQAIRFEESEVRSMGRTAAGVKAINLKKGDTITGVDIIEKGKGDNQRLLVLTSKGYGKQTFVSKYKSQKRGGSGIKTSKVTKKTGNVITAKLVNDEIEKVLAFSEKGKVIKTKLKDVRVSGRATQGVKIMNLGKDDYLVGVVCL